MFETSEPWTSKVEKSNHLNSNAEECQIELDEIEVNENCSSLWSIDDTMFYAQGLKHHSAGKGRSLYVTWDENYLLNFVFKTSSKAVTTLTKVRISMPVYNQQQEKISNMLILEMNTLLHMQSGRVYYFSSIKSMHRVDWLNGVCCMSSCPPTQFSVIRLVCTTNDVHDQKKILSLEVYKDSPRLGEHVGNDVLMHCYDITFDFENLFNCDWLDESYTLISFITDQNNINFLQQLVSIGDIFHTKEEITDLHINQEVHIFTISGNVLVLVGATVLEDVLITNRQVNKFCVHLLNTYACPIECIRIDCVRNLLIVLLQSGHLDIWYKSKRMFGTLLHLHYELSNFLCYDFSHSNNMFFTTPEEVVELTIFTNNNINVEKECIIEETRKYLSGMTACTFVESLQQLICISFNNIFYRINFSKQTESAKNVTRSETHVENLNNLYTLNLKRINVLRSKANIVSGLMEQPKQLHNAIENEFRKQQVLTLESKSDLFKKSVECHLEYHTHLPAIEYFDNDFVHIKTSFRSLKINSQSIFCLIFLSIKNNTDHFLSSILTAGMWYMNISYFDQVFQLHIPYQILNNKLCVIVDIPLSGHLQHLLPKLSLDLVTFLSHGCHSVCLKYNLNLMTNEKTYINMFGLNIKNLQIFRNSFSDIKDLLRTHSNNSSNSKNISKCDEIYFKLKQSYKIPKNVLYNTMEKIKAKLAWSTCVDLKIYYLHKYLIELIYDDVKEIVTICSNYPIAIYHLKLLLAHAMQNINVSDVAETSCNTMQQMLINNGSIILDDIDSNLFSMHLENLRNFYLKLRL